MHFSIVEDAQILGLVMLESHNILFKYQNATQQSSYTRSPLLNLNSLDL